MWELSSFFSGGGLPIKFPAMATARLSGGCSLVRCVVGGGGCFKLGIKASLEMVLIGQKIRQKVARKTCKNSEISNYGCRQALTSAPAVGNGSRGSSEVGGSSKSSPEKVDSSKGASLLLLLLPPLLSRQPFLLFSAIISSSSGLSHVPVFSGGVVGVFHHIKIQGGARSAVQHRDADILSHGALAKQEERAELRATAPIPAVLGATTFMVASVGKTNAAAL